MNVAIIDYGIGNLGSVAKALESTGARPKRVVNPSELSKFDAIVLPGVGNFTRCKNLLDKLGWSTAIRHEAIANRKQILGICVGMQLLADSGEEGAENDSSTLGLGLIAGKVKSLRKFGCRLRLPHVGWNSVYPKTITPLMRGINNETDFYFVHSYGFQLKTESNCVAIFNYGVDVPAVINNDNVWGTQFHPEKSSKAGLLLLANFLRGAGC